MDVVVCVCAAGTDEDSRGVVRRLAGTLGGVGIVLEDGIDNDIWVEKVGELLQLGEEQSVIL